MTSSVPPTNSNECFPRTQTLPKQSPIYWVDQKDRYLRQQLISDIESLTKRRLIVYYTNPSEDGMIDLSDDRFVAELLTDLQGEQSVDFFLETPGGVIDAAHKIIKQLRQYSPDFRVLVPHSVKSAGTLISLVGKKIVMGPHSELGPADPIINGMPACHIVNCQEHPDVSPILVESAKKAIVKCIEIAEEQTRLSQPQMNDTEIKQLAVTLCVNEKFHTHGTPISVIDAQELKLPIESLGENDQLWKRLWLLYCMYSYDCTLKGFSKVFETRRVSHALTQTGS